MDAAVKLAVARVIEDLGLNELINWLSQNVEPLFIMLSPQNEALAHDSLQRTRDYMVKTYATHLQT